MGWERIDDDTWALIRERLPRPLAPAEAAQDIRWWTYSSTRVRPPLRALAESWGWYAATGAPSIKRVRRLISSGGWEDEYKNSTAGAREGHARGTRGAREGHARGTRGAREGHAADGPTCDIPEAGAREGHARGTRGAREGHARGTRGAREGHARGSPVVRARPTQTQTQSTGTDTDTDHTTRPRADVAAVWAHWRGLTPGYPATAGKASRAAISKWLKDASAADICLWLDLSIQGPSWFAEQGIKKFGVIMRDKWREDGLVEARQWAADGRPARAKRATRGAVDGWAAFDGVFEAMDREKQRMNHGK